MSPLFSSGDYETRDDVVVVRATKEATAKAEELVDSAVTSAENGVDAPEAVFALQAINASVKEVDVALGLLRLEYFPFELREANKAWRYLVAVKHGRDVSPMTPEEAHRIERIEALVGLEPEQAYEQLQNLEPRLAEVEQFARQQRSESTARGVNNNRFFRIEEMLTPYLGSKSTQSDSLLSSRYAFHMARLHLIDVAGLLTGR